MRKHGRWRALTRLGSFWGALLVPLLMLASPALCREASGKVVLGAWNVVCCIEEGAGAPEGPASSALVPSGSDYCSDTPVPARAGQAPAVVSASLGACLDVVPPQPPAFPELRTAAFLLPPCRAWRTVFLLI
ncbi:hypothetical protein HRbin09_01635 [bacterium HR09]|nr:hypothetical protein HRbin09_01635 [bacterium HR09]